MADVPPCSVPDSPPLTSQDMRDTDLIVMNRLRNRAIYNRTTDRYEGHEQENDTLLPITKTSTASSGNQDTPLGPPEPAGASSNPIVVDNDRDGSRVHPIDQRKPAISISQEPTKPKKASRKGDIPVSDKPTWKQNTGQPRRRSNNRPVQEPTPQGPGTGRSRNQQRNHHNNQGDMDQTNAPWTSPPTTTATTPPGPMGPPRDHKPGSPIPTGGSHIGSLPCPWAHKQPLAAALAPGALSPPAPIHPRVPPHLNHAKLDLIIHQVRMALMHREGP